MVSASLLNEACLLLFQDLANPSYDEAFFKYLDRRNRGMAVRGMAVRAMAVRAMAVRGMAVRGMAMRIYKYPTYPVFPYSRTPYPVSRTLLPDLSPKYQIQGSNLKALCDQFRALGLVGSLLNLR